MDKRKGENNLHYKHGFACKNRKTKEYNVWVMMRQRCLNQRNKDYRNYGGRGITFCDRWNSYPLFLSDMGHAPTNKHSIDRIDNNGNYTPSNCRWITNKEQCNNTRKNIVITFDGKTMTLKQWAEYLKQPYSKFMYRHVAKWPVERLLTESL